MDEDQISHLCAAEGPHGSLNVSRTDRFIVAHCESCGVLFSVLLSEAGEAIGLNVSTENMDVGSPALT